MEKVLLALSGGVDSSAAAILLKEQGYEVYSTVFIMSDFHLEVAEAAKKVAAELEIPIEVLDLRDEFREKVIAPFCREYCCGRTPSPCVMCNPLVKFRALAELADSMAIEKIATGHYGKIIKTENGVSVSVSDCIQRDQSYMLYRLPQDILCRLLLPIEGYSKDEVREIAASRGISSAYSPDSEENCFIKGEDYVSFLERNGYKGKDGFCILPDGRKIAHKGIHRFTVGQRKGLGISYTEPIYVKSIDPDGTVQLCTSGGEYSSVVTLKDTVINPCYAIKAGDEFLVKIRSAARKVSAKVTDISENAITLLFDPPVRAACPGQSAVLYKENVVAGGGIIDTIG